jgi:UDP-N-acetylmuramoyl-tripeptide--D-alanyl-D-alanine ligase
LQGHPSRKLAHAIATGVSVDSRTVAKGELFFAIRGERFDGHDFIDAALERGAVAAVVDGETAPDERPLIYVNDTGAALRRLAAHHRGQRSVNVVAVTGSNGKTTTKSMIHHVLGQRLRGRAAPKSYNNAVGVPLTLLSAEAGDEYLVVEIGSNAPGEVAALARLASPNIGVVTSIGDAHLKGFDDRGGVAREKLSLLDQIRKSGLAVLNADCPECAVMVRRLTDRHVVTFGTGESADVRVTDVRSCLDETRFVINGKTRVTLPCPGRHNALNAAAAFAVSRRLHVDPEQFVEAMATFSPPPMRLAVSRVGGLTLIDDSYNANPTSTRAAIEVLQSAGRGRRVFVGGEMLELGDDAAAFHEQAGRAIAEAGVDLLVAIGEHAPDVIAGAHSIARRLTSVFYADTETACGDLPNWLGDADTVLIKGSRGLGLERVAGCVRKAFA